MFNIDKSLKNIMGKNNTNFNSKQSLPTFKPIQTNVSMNMLSNVNSKPASQRMQMQWKSFSAPVKNQMRMKYKDTDGDRVPNRWDCNPNNPFETSRFKPYKYKWIETKQTIPEHRINGRVVQEGKHYFKHEKKLVPADENEEISRRMNEPSIFKNPEGQTIKISPKLLNETTAYGDLENDKQMLADTVAYTIDTMPKEYLHKKSNVTLTTPVEHNKREFLKQANIKFGGHINYENIDRAQELKEMIMQKNRHTIAQHQVKNKPGAIINFNRDDDGESNPQFIRTQRGENITFLNMPSDNQRFKQVMFHEVGHGIARRYPEVKEEYEHTKKKYGLPVSSAYGSENEEEDFAEAFAISHKDIGTIHDREKSLYGESLIKLSDQLKNESIEGTFGHIKRSESPLDIDIRTQSPAHLIHTADWSRVPNKAEQPLLQPEGASLQKQQEWQNMPQEQKSVMSNMLPDKDGDNVPDQYDCEPLNPNKQEQDDSDDVGPFKIWKRDIEPNKNLKKQEDDMREYEKRMNFLQPRPRDFDGKIRYRR